MNRLLTLLILFNPLCSLTSSAQSIAPRFKYILKDQGLASNKVLCITQDSRGFMWFGTEDGLTRFDGTNYTVFRHNPKDENTLLNNYVNVVYQDPFSGNLWIGTSKGLCYLNIKNNKFYPFEERADASLYNKGVLSVLVDQSRTIWVGTYEGLFLKKPNGETRLVLENPNKELKSNISCLFKDSAGNIWIGTIFGLYVLKETSSAIRPVRINTNGVKVLSVTEDSKKQIWVSSFDSGVYKLKGTTVTRFNKANGFLKSNKVQGVVEDRFGNVYMAVRDGGGLYCLDTKRNSIKVYSNDVYNSNSISSSALTCIYKDNFENIWIGTWAKGLNFLDSHQKLFAHYKVNYRSDGLTSNNIRALYQDSRGKIWIGTKDEGGLSSFDPAKGNFQHFKSWLYNPETKGYSFVLSITEAQPGKLLVGTYDKGLNLFDPKTGTFTRFLHNPSDKSSIADNMAACLYKDRRGTIWVATTRALQIYNSTAGTFKTVSDSSYVKCFYDYSEDELFYGGRVGLFSYNRKTGKTTYFHVTHSFSDRSEVPDITGIGKDDKGNLWLTTVGKGLIHFNYRTRKFTVFDNNNGLISNITCAIQNDNAGRFWISTSNGLVNFNPHTGQLRNYYMGEGLQGNEFEKYVSLKTNDGHLLFGGSNGFNYFLPDSIKDNPIIPKVVLTDFRIFNKPVPVGEDDDAVLKESITSARNLELSYKHSVITFEFSALNFSDPEYNQYAYKLEPLERDWNYSGTRNIVSYSSLPPGDYVFRVKASNNDGLWNEVPTYLNIKVIPPPWASWWAYLLYGLVVTGLVYAWIRYKNFETKLRISLLEKEKLKELNDIKARFFTNISHEFKTPLTMILSPLNKLISKSTTEEDQLILGYIKRNSLRLQNLINQLTELRIIEHHKLEPQYQVGNISRFIVDLTELFVPLAEDHGIEIVIRAEQNIITMYDADKTEKILFNLFSNAVKFTPHGGIIHLRVTVVKNDRFGGQFIRICVGNTGSEISEDRLEHIFTNYYHINRVNSLSQPNSGIGLAYSKELVELLGGTIEAKSKDNYTSFTVNLPLKEAEQPDCEAALNLKQTDFMYSQQLMEVLKFEIGAHYTKSNIKGEAILLVEDNKELRSFLFHSLCKNYKVILADNGYDALELAKLNHPALIVSDVVMPRLDGIELCREIKSNIALSHIPVILLTASEAVSKRKIGMENGADVYIEKPFDLEYLLLQIRNIIQTRKAQREMYSKKLAVESQPSENATLDEQWVMNATSIVEQNIDNLDFNVDAFVKAMNMSRTALYQKIKALTDLPINEFIINVRLKKAAELLKNTNYTISEVAYKVGFSSPNYFGICFKRYFRISPKTFLEEHKNKKTTIS